MRKFLMGLAAALLLYIPVAAQAAVVTNTTDQLFNAVGETSSTLRVNTRFTQLSVFVSGTYAAGNTVVLQRGVGSPGSGAFENVVTVTTGTANARLVTRWDTGPNPESYRLKMTATGTGDVVAYLTDWPITARAWATGATRIVMFDDFTGDNSASTTVINASKYVSETQSTSGGTIAANTVAIQEGGVSIVSGDDSSNAGDEATCMSAITAASFGGLVSDGIISFEARLQADSINGIVAAGLIDIACVADNVPVADIDSGTVTFNGATAGGAMIWQQDEATNVDSFQAISALANVEGANALEVPLGTVIVAATYYTLRVETDTTGNAYFYVDGTLQHAEPLAVTTTDRLVPMIQAVATIDGTSEAVTIIVDYWEFMVPRPAS